MTTVKGILATAVALVVCPCHLPLTLPLALGLLGGSALGLWLAQNTWLVWLAATGLFLGFLALGFHWLTQEPQTCSLEQAKGHSAVPSSTDRGIA